MATDCGWSRHRPQDVEPLIELHRDVRRRSSRADGRDDVRLAAGWERIPDEDWTTEPVDAFGASYDNVAQHSWYRNLDPTVEELAHLLADGEILVDYSGGTGILVDRLKLRLFGTQAGAVIVDSSPKFLRAALEKFGDDPRVGLRLLRYLKEEKRLQRPRRGPRRRAPRARRRRDRLDQRRPPVPRPRRHGGVVAARPAPGRARAGQLRQHPQPAGPASEWILDETVWVVGDLAEGWCAPIRRTPPTA